MKNSKKSMALAFCVLLIVSCGLSAQTFNLEITPNTQTISIGQTSTFFVAVKPVNGYNASVFVSVNATPQFYGTVELSTATINPPYKIATLKITPSIQDTGTKVIELKAMNNGVSATATCSLTIQKNVQWTTLKPPSIIQWRSNDNSVSLRTDNKGDICYAVYQNSFPTYSVSINHYRNHQWESDVFTSSIIAISYNNIAFALDPNGVYWFTPIYGQGGIIRFDGKFTTYFNSTNSELISEGPLFVDIDRNNMPVGITEDKHGDSYLTRFDGAEWKSFKLTIPKDSQNKTVSLQRSCIDSANRMWVGTNGGGIIRMSDTVQEYISAKDNKSLWSDNIQQVLCDKDGGIWCMYGGNSNEKVISYLDGNEWKHIDSPVNMGYVITFFVDENKNVWLSTSEGLHFYNGTRWTTYNKSNSPLTKQVRRMVQDRNKNIWMVIDDLFYVFNPNGLVDIPLAPTGVEEQPVITDGGVTISPNPASENFTILGVNEISSVTIVNSLGMEVKTLNGSHALDVSDVANGIYFVQICTPSGMITKSIVVSR